MTFKHFSMVSCAAFALCACQPAAEETAQTPNTEATEQIAQPETLPAQMESDNTAGERTASIDWATARADFDTQEGADEPVVNVASADGSPPPVPILLPTGGPASVATNGRGPRFKQTADGYYAAYPYENYDVIVNGTNEVIGPRADGPRDETAKFTATAAGAQISLSRYGADYLVEFECYEINPETGTCVEEAEALEVAESLVIRRTR